MPPIPKKGSMAMAKMTIPMPPRPLRIARHSNMARGVWSRLVIMVAPVVLIPEEASNTASAQFSTVPYRINGIEAIKVTENQLTTVNKYPCWRLTLSMRILLARNMDIPRNRAIIEDEKNGDQEFPVS